MIKRLSRYLNYLKNLEVKSVSATKMAEFLNIHHTQVRRDLSLIGVNGAPKVGHDLKETISAIETFLSWKDTQHAFLVGVGNLGSALLKYNGFVKSGIEIIAAFDTDKKKVERKKIGEISIFPLSKMENLLKRTRVAIGIITTPDEVAQRIVESMVRGGILAIWNFTHTCLQVGEGIIVENADLDANLAVLTRRLQERKTS
jgi:redox-sensing transcriptional repressor